MINQSSNPADKAFTLLSRRELAQRLHVCTHTIQRWERRGLIKSIRFNARVVRYRVEDVEKLIREASV